ncbi:MAG TPA: MlaD family protein [Candidatus Binatia bacterium]|jgi:phospholipid/cholesterol/gamma-HCH transport system substrate-binding protein|nr:MlaD family protein [Candidatus Binatia bacterium]
MSKTRVEWKVGLFVFMGLVLLAGLLLAFSKGLTFFRPTYTIFLRAPDVGGLKVRAGVLMAGVQIGTVSDIVLPRAGTNVLIILKIYSKYEIHKDAHFEIQTSGFLGDQFVAVIPTQNKEPLFRDNEEAEADAPFNILEFVASSRGLIDRIEGTVARLDQTITNVNYLLLNERTLTNVTETVATLRVLSAHTLVTIDNVNGLLSSNSPAVSVAVSNLAFFSGELNLMAGGLTNLVATNAPTLHTALKNVESSSETLKSVLDDVRAGKGSVGSLLSDQQLAANLSQITSNLSITSSNLNRLGLWGILWRHKPPRTNASPAPALIITSPKNRHD